MRCDCWFDRPPLIQIELAVVVNQPFCVGVFLGLYIRDNSWLSDLLFKFDHSNC